MIKRNQDQGFTLPTAMGMGFILMMLTAAMLERAHSAQVTAGMQARSELSTAIAEAGITRVQSFFDRQRALVTYNATEWSMALAKFGDCMDVATANQYAQAHWLDLPQGRYRVLSYTFSPTVKDHGQIGVGKLLIEGQTTTFDQATSVIAVEIPVSVVETKLPALWTTALQIGKNQKITGDTRLQQCPDKRDPDGVPGISADQISLQPDGQPSGQIAAIPFPWTRPLVAPNHTIDLPVIRDDITLPRPGDLPDEHGQYHYQVSADLHNDSIDLPPGKQLQVNLQDQQSVSFYLQGNARISGLVLAMDAAKNILPSKLRIYGSANTTKFLIGDNAQINGLVHAPLAAGQSYREATPTKLANTLTGILWLHTWQGDESKLSIVQAGTWADLQIPPRDKLGVRIHPLSSWQRQAKS
jgi:hypothetical protein